MIDNVMKGVLMKRLCLILILFAGVAAWAVNNPNVASPVGSPTAVPSATRSGLIRSPSASAFNSNDIVTGNVGGMYHFRGVVPYSSSYYSRSSAYSSVDDFLRRSYDPISNDRAFSPYRSYYDPRRTVNSSVRADGSGLFSPVITPQGQTDPYTPPMLPQLKNTPYGRQRPLSMSASELEAIIAKQMDVRRQADEQRNKITSSETAKDKRVDESLFFQNYLKSQDIPRQQEPAKPDDDPNRLDQQPQQNPDDVQPSETDATTPQPPSNPLLEQYLSDKETQQEPAPALSENDKAQAAALLSQYGTFEKLAAARVAEYLAAGETHLKEGQFYKAADMFAMAVLWDAADARPFAGQAFSLFAAGEYMSSAFYLSQAILRNPTVASYPVDLAKLIGDRDVFENRIIEMTTWQERSGSGELAFMAAFVLYHDGKTQRAAEFIHIAAEKMPNDKAVAALYTVILPDESKP